MSPNLNLILILHIFFYNTYVTCIYPLLFAYIKEQNINVSYSFIIIALTYISSYFSIIAFYHNTKTKNVPIQLAHNCFKYKN